MLRAKDSIILDIANKIKPSRDTKFVPIDVSLNFKSDYYDKFPKLSNLMDNKVFKTGTVERLNLLVDFDNDMEDDSIFSLRLDKYEYGDDRKENAIVSKLLVTENEYKEYYSDGESDGEIDFDFSKELEIYLTGTTGKADTFLDLIVPVVDNLTVSLVYRDVILLTELPNWINVLNPNPLRKTTDKTLLTKPADKTITQDLQNKVEECFTNYFNTIYGIYSMLSAGYRGDDLTTPEIMDSCIETPNFGSDLVVRGQYLSPVATPRLPLFSKAFIKQVLLGFIPMFSLYSQVMEKETKGCDLFYDLKRAIIDNIHHEIRNLKIYQSKYNLPTELIYTSEITKSYKPFNNLFPNDIRVTSNNKSQEVSRGNYHMEMLDCVSYDCIFKALMPTLNERQYRLADLFNMMSPVQLKNAYK